MFDPADTADRFTIANPRGTRVLIRPIYLHGEAIETTVVGPARVTDDGLVRVPIEGRSKPVWIGAVEVVS